MKNIKHAWAPHWTAFYLWFQNAAQRKQDVVLCFDSAYWDRGAGTHNQMSADVHRWCKDAEKQYGTRLMWMREDDVYRIRIMGD